MPGACLCSGGAREQTPVNYYSICELSPRCGAEFYSKRRTGKKKRLYCPRREFFLLVKTKLTKWSWFISNMEKTFSLKKCASLVLILFKWENVVWNVNWEKMEKILIK